MRKGARFHDDRLASEAPFERREIALNTVMKGLARSRKKAKALDVVTATFRFNHLPHRCAVTAPHSSSGYRACKPWIATSSLKSEKL